MNIYYVYAYIRKDGSPYYIGKGKGSRAFSKQHSVSVPKDRSKIVFINTKLTEQESLDIEIEYIRILGRKDNKSGILYNRTDGGDGVQLFGSNNGMYGRKHSKESIIKMSKNRSGIKDTIETKVKKSKSLSGRSLSEEHKRKIGDAGRGRILWDAHEKAFGDANRKRHKPLSPIV